MILDLDVGNTRCKWRLTDGVQGEGGSGSATLEQFCSGNFDGIQVARVRVSSVRGPEVEATVTRWAESRLGVSAEFARSVPRLGGVVNGYANPQQLGVDRWLGIIAGYHEVGSVVHVIDCGSAITADLVDRGGVHRGGYISPGVAMMTQSLLHGTDRVRFASRSQIREATPGKDTSEAVAHGALLAACGFVSQACGRFNEISGDAVVLLTGGDAELIQRTLGLRANLRPSLVLDGLALALP